MDANDPSFRAIFESADKDQSGQIDYHEFQRSFGELIQPSTSGGHGLHIQNTSGTMGKSGGLGNNLHAAAAAPKNSSTKGVSAMPQPQQQPQSRVSQPQQYSGTDNNKALFHDKIKQKFKSLHACFRW